MQECKRLFNIQILTSAERFQGFVPMAYASTILEVFTVNVQEDSATTIYYLYVKVCNLFINILHVVWFRRDLTYVKHLYMHL